MPFRKSRNVIRSLPVSFPYLYKTDRIHRALVQAIGMNNIKTMKQEWEQRLSDHQKKNKWMTPRDMRRLVLLGLRLGLDRAPKQRILDLGCGTGYFLYVCRHFGHDVMGIDLPRNGLFDAWVSFLKIPRVLFRIQPYTPLPPSDGPFDLITAILPTFHKGWTEAEWKFFLNDVHSRLSPNGKAYVMSNIAKSSQMLSNVEFKNFFTSLPTFEAQMLTPREVLLHRKQIAS